MNQLKGKKLKNLGLAIAMTMMASTAGAGTVFFGEDLNPGGTVPAGGASEVARNAFLSNLQGVGTEDFEGIAAGTNADGLVLNFPGATGGITATLNDTSGLAEIENVSPFAGRFATSGSNYLNQVTNEFSLDFSTDIAAFGFYATDIGDFNGQITLTLTGGGVQVLTVDNTLNGPNGSLLFWGFIADAGETFSSVAFGNTNAGTDFFGFDDLTIGELGQVVDPNPVPEPGTLALLSLGLGLAGFAGRRKKA